MTSISTEQLTITRTLYPLAWGAHAPGIQLLEANKSAKYIGGAAAAALGAEGYIVGTAAATWDIKIKIGTRIRTGVALSTRNLSSAAPGPDVAGIQFDVMEGDTIRVALSAAAVLTIMLLRQPVGNMISLTAFTGQKMYPWVCNATAEDYSATISSIHEATARIDAGGAFEISTVSPLGAGTAVNLLTAGGGLFLDGKAVAAFGAGGDIKVSGTVYADFIQSYTPGAELVLGTTAELTSIPSHVYAAVYVEANTDHTSFPGPDQYAAAEGKTQTQINKGMDTGANGRIANIGPAATFRATCHATGLPSADDITHSFLFYLSGNPVPGSYQSQFVRQNTTRFTVGLSSIIDMAQNDYIELWTTTSNGDKYQVTDYNLALERLL